MLFKKDNLVSAVMIATNGSPGLWGKKQKNAEKKQPCKLKHDCFTTANKFQVKTLGVNKKKFLDREKYPL